MIANCPFISARPELVEPKATAGQRLSFLQALRSAKGQGFDKLSPSGFGISL